MIWGCSGSPILDTNLGGNITTISDESSTDCHGRCERCPLPEVSPPQRHLQSVTEQPGGHRPADHGMQVHHYSQIKPAFTGHQVSDVADRLFIRLGGLKAFLQ